VLNGDVFIGLKSHSVMFNQVFHFLSHITSCKKSFKNLSSASPPHLRQKAVLLGLCAERQPPVFNCDH